MIRPDRLLVSSINQPNQFKLAPRKFTLFASVCVGFMHFQIGLKGEVSRRFAVISKPKNVCLSTETKM